MRPKSCHSCAGCPDGWFAGQSPFCYRVFSDEEFTSSFLDAHKMCSSMVGILASPKTAQEASDVAKLVSSEAETANIGLNDGESCDVKDEEQKEPVFSKYVCQIPKGQIGDMVKK